MGKEIHHISCNCECCEPCGQGDLEGEIGHEHPCDWGANEIHHAACGCSSCLDINLEIAEQVGSWVYDLYVTDCKDECLFHYSEIGQWYCEGQYENENNAPFFK